MYVPQQVPLPMFMIPLQQTLAEGLYIFVPQQVPVPEFKIPLQQTLDAGL
jgi:hypothetical protein